MTVIEKLKRELFQLVKMDYGFEIYNMNQTVVRFSFYHLGSVYNALCSSVYFQGKWSEPGVDWQYAQVNKTAAKHAIAITGCLMLMQGTADDLAEKEVSFYKALSEKVFEAKYSISVELHTMGGN